MKGARVKMFTNLFLLLFSLSRVHCAAVDELEVEQEGLYHRRDSVVIITHRNINRNLYGQPHAWFMQFYNSNCGHCRALYPKFKAFAKDVARWKKVVRVGVIDCIQEDNAIECRNFEVRAYPTLTYFHENYVPGNNNIGDQLSPLVRFSEHDITNTLVDKLVEEQKQGRLMHCPSLLIESYDTLKEALLSVPTSIKYTFLIFEEMNSTVGVKVILDTSLYKNIAVKLVSSTSRLSDLLAITKFPALAAARNDLQVTSLTPKVSNRETIVHAIDIFLQSKNIPIPIVDTEIEFVPLQTNNVKLNNDDDNVLLDDLEAALDITLRREIARYRTTNGESLTALRNFIIALIDYFPLTTNGKMFMIDLKSRLMSNDDIPGQELENWVKDLMIQHRPVWWTPAKFVKCQGSQANFRGHTCGLWVMFHTMTVSASNSRYGSGADVLNAIHGYVKHFFTCTECSTHFQEMSRKNNITQVREKEKAVLWLWIAHNEVNLRLAGDSTEDPKYPKVQFPVAERCPSCRSSLGAWKLDAVLSYLQHVYSNAGAKTQQFGYSKSTGGQLSSLDLLLTVTLYLFSFLMILVACKMLLTRMRWFQQLGRFLRKHSYQN